MIDASAAVQRYLTDVPVQESEQAETIRGSEVSKAVVNLLFFFLCCCRTRCTATTLYGVRYRFSVLASQNLLHCEDSPRRSAIQRIL